jgi:tetratricopeptide (TPR) repeat protein
MSELLQPASPIATDETPTPSRGGFWTRPITLAVVLAVATFIIYAPTLQHDFVDYDDGQYVGSNSHVQAGLTWAGVKWAFVTGEASNWHPLTWLSHMFDVTVFGKQANGHHFTSLAFHCLNAALVSLLLRCITGKLWPSLIVAALFALHPLHVESVAWVSERKDVLSACFGLLSLLAYARYVTSDKWHVTGNGGALVSPVTCHLSPSYWLSLLFFAIGLMSKPMLVTLPFVMLLLDYWPLQRFSASTLQQKLRLALEKIPFFALCVVSSVVTFLVQKKGGAVSEALPFSARAANACVSYVRYLRKTIWPDDLSVLYPHPGHWPASHVAGAAILLVLLTVVALIYWKRMPFVIVGWLWFVGMLVPVIGLVQVGIQSMADRYTYLPLLGVFIAIVWSADAVLSRWPAWKPAFGVLAILSLGICVLITQVQLRIWANSETLFGHAITVTQDNYLAHNNLGFYLANKGRKTEAMECYRASLKIRPDYADAQNNLGHALADERKYAEAIQHYRIALRSSPENLEVHNNLGNALTEVGQVDAAIAEYEFVLKRNPDHANAHNNFGIALAMKGRLDEAMRHFHDALRLKPDDASAHGNLGNAFAVQHKFADATKHYREALRLAPSDAQTRNNLGNVLAEQGQFSEAVTNYRAALELNANNPEAHFNLGCALSRLGKIDEARRHYAEALRLKPNYTEARKQLEMLNLPVKP